MPGNCEEAFKLYKKVFGGEYLSFLKYSEAPPESNLKEDEKDKIMHVSLPIGENSLLMGSDRPEHTGENIAGNNFSVLISPDSELQADDYFKGLSEGGSIIMPMQKTFWGAYYGMLTDRFGINWMISYDYKS
jgi:PhnB protein